MITDPESITKQQLLELLEQYRELVVCAWARSIPHEGTDLAESDWCAWYMEQYRPDVKHPPGSRPWIGEGDDDPAVVRDRVIINFFNGDHLKPEKFGWCLLTEDKST